MEIQELNKKQLVLLTLLITFVVSIATGIITVSLMNQAPKSVPQTINNVIQRTIEKVTTVQAPLLTQTSIPSQNSDGSLISSSDEVLIPIYPVDAEIKKDTTVSQVSSNSSQNANSIDQTAQAVNVIGSDVTNSTDTKNPDASKSDKPKPLGYGVIISDIGLVLFDSDMLTKDKDVYKVTLNNIDFDATILKKFLNGFTILKITSKKKLVEPPKSTDTKSPDTSKNPGTESPNSKIIDKKI